MDVDLAAQANPFIDEFRPLQGDRWPLADDTVDLCLADYVIEHVREPDAFFAECQRVVKPDGYLCIRTANLHSYVGIASKLIDNKHHAALLQKVQEKRRPEDVFSTVYHCNTVSKLREALNRHRFDATVYGTESEPMYLAFSSVAYWLGVLHQKYAPGSLKAALFAFARKRDR